MDFGMPTLIEIKSIEKTAMLCYELGLTFIELNMNLPEYQVNRLDIEWFAEIADKYGIYYTIHLDENCNPCDFNERVSAAHTETVIRTIDIAYSMPSASRRLSLIQPSKYSEMLCRSTPLISGRSLNAVRYSVR